MGTIIQRKFEKTFKQLSEDLIEFLISGNCSNEQVESERQKDFLLISNVLSNISTFISSKLKVQMLNFNSQLEEMQKKFVLDFKQSK